MKKNYLVGLLALIFTGITIWLCFRNYQLRKELSIPKPVITKIDTVYTRKQFHPIKQYKFTQVPEMVIYYGTPKKASDSIGSSNNPSNLSYDNSRDSIVQVLIDKEKLTLNFLNDSLGRYSSKIFDLDLGSYKYNWVDGNLTKQKVHNISLKPYLYGQYRYFHNMLDFGGGLSFKTKSFNYKLGVNTSYYPIYISEVQVDLEFKLEYNF